MIKILILAYDFPPYVSVGGLRPSSWFNYMAEFGGFPIVITRQWNNKYSNHLDYIAPSDSPETLFERSEKGLIIRTPYTPNASNRLLLKYGDSKFRLLRKGISAFYEFGQFLFPIGPRSNLYFEAEKYLAENKVDIIIATGEPFILFKYASELSRKYKIPWIADYRDPWTQNKAKRNKGVPKKWDAFFEKKYLSNVSAVTTVSRYVQKQISSLISHKSFYIIPNGYDPEAVEKVKEIEQSKEKLSIAIGGTIYQWHPIESFLRVADDFVKSFVKEPKFELNFYGTNLEKEINNLIKTKYQALNSIVNIHPKMPNEQFLKKLAANNIFLLFNDYNIMGTKIYDNLALKRRIMLCYDDDDEAKELKKKYFKPEEEDSESDHLQKQVINETDSGIVIKDANHLKHILSDFYSEFEAEGFISCNSVNTERYSRKIQVRNLMETIKNVLVTHKNQ